LFKIIAMLKFTFIVTLILGFLFINELNAQLLFEENFDSTPEGSIPSGWQQSANFFSTVTSTQACSGNAFRMNLYSGHPSGFLDSPEIERDSVPGNISISFDLRNTDYANNTQLTGTGRLYLQLFVNNSFVSDLISNDPIFYVDCETQTINIPAAVIPLGSNFKLRFSGIWSAGDWIYGIDNVSARIVNDECDQAVLLTQTEFPAGILTSDVVDGSLEGASSSQSACTGNANDDVWYKFVANQPSVSITVQAGNVVVELFSGNCGSLTSLICKDEGYVNEIFDYHGTEVGETFYIRVYSFADTLIRGTDAEFRIQIGTPKSVNNECESAIVLSQSSATSCGTNLIMGTVEDATESQSACKGTANDDVWYQFVATSNDFSVYLESGDFVIELFEGTCGNLNQLVCMDNLPINETFNYSSASIGNTYFLRVHSYGSTSLIGEDAEFGICVFTSPPVPANDDCSNPIDLFVTLSDSCSSVVSGTTNGGSRTENNSLCSGINGQSSSWYRFTAKNSEHIITLSNVDILNGSDNDASSFEVFSGPCNSLTSIFCSGQRFGSNPAPLTINGLTANQEYLIRVVPVNPYHQINFDICISTPCPELPFALSWSDVTSTSVSLAILVNETATRSFVLVAKGNDPLDSTNLLYNNSTEDTEIVATGLLPNTEYDFYILSCGDTEFTAPLPFKTCPALPSVMQVFQTTNTSARLLIYSTGGGERTFVVVANGDNVMDPGNHVFTETSMDTVVEASGFMPNTNYEFYIQSCDSTDLSGPIAFTTTCDLASGLIVNNITTTSATLSIDLEGAQERDYVVMPVGEPPVFGGNNFAYFASSSEGTDTANNLNPNTSYDFYVGQGCDESFAGPITFTTNELPVNVQMTIDYPIIFDEISKGLLLKNALGDQYLVSLDTNFQFNVVLDNDAQPSSYLLEGDLVINYESGPIIFRTESNVYGVLGINIFDGELLTANSLYPNSSDPKLRLEQESFGLLENGAGIILKDIFNFDCWKLYINNDGELVTSKVTCPN
jgi:hypothetical protein